MNNATERGAGIKGVGGTFLPGRIPLYPSHFPMAPTFQNPVLVVSPESCAIDGVERDWFILWCDDIEHVIAEEGDSLGCLREAVVDFGNKDAFAIPGCVAWTVW